jgi:hypothetical protein
MKNKALFVAASFMGHIFYDIFSYNDNENEFKLIHSIKTDKKQKAVIWAEKRGMIINPLDKIYC